MKVERLETAVYRVPCDRPEGDGTLAWDSTTVVVVEAVADSDRRGLGFTYGSAAAAAVVKGVLEGEVTGRPPGEVRQVWEGMVRAVRNLGRPGIASTAISAVDLALWDLHGKALDQPLFRLLGARRNAVRAYGSGGFTTYTTDQLVEQLGGWVEQGMSAVKMKIGVDRGRCPELDLERVAAVRRAIGPSPKLFVDANGAYSRKQAIGLGARLQELGVSYFEEPVSSDQFSDLAAVRRALPMDVAAGEYGYDPWYFERMLQAGAVDVLQADVSRCLGVTGWLEGASLAHARGLPFSAHCCPSLHLHAACAAPEIAHVEYFWDHVRLESMLFEGAVTADSDGKLRPAADRPGLGLELKRAEAERWRVG
ncbi:MAG: mandelate racemase [Candidatus Dormibacteraeota bacterium]|nr:mandelate racemase [Candidatus Dormibacteraeota bacterium]